MRDINRVRIGNWIMVLLSVDTCFANGRVTSANRAVLITKVIFLNKLLNAGEIEMAHF
jgi:hypothetical protein